MRLFLCAPYDYAANIPTFSYPIISESLSLSSSLAEGISNFTGLPKFSPVF